MSTDNATLSTLQDGPPSTSATVPGFPNVTAFHDGNRPYRGAAKASADIGERIRVEFSGTADDLLACGVVTPSMLAVNNASHHGGPRIKRIDADGDPFRLTRYWRSTNLQTGEPCPPYRLYCVVRFKPLAVMRLLPGASEAIAAYAEYDRWRQAWAQRRAAEESVRSQPPAPRRGPQLRLVVDNTAASPIEEGRP